LKPTWYRLADHELTESGGEITWNQFLVEMGAELSKDGTTTTPSAPVPAEGLARLQAITVRV